jgi:hypothetical protein
MVIFSSIAMESSAVVKSRFALIGKGPALFCFDLLLSKSNFKAVVILSSLKTSSMRGWWPLLIILPSPVRTMSVVRGGYRGVRPLLSTRSE